jgi:hypothetical protein
MYNPELILARQNDSEQRWEDHQELKRKFGENHYFVKWADQLLYLVDQLSEMRNEIDNCFDPIEEAKLVGRFKCFANDIQKLIDSERSKE